MTDIQAQAVAFIGATRTFAPGKPAWVPGHNDAGGPA
jgi:hypothetical protein